MRRAQIFGSGSTMALEEVYNYLEEDAGNLTEKVLPPEDIHSELLVINLHFEILPGHISLSSGMYLQRVLSKSTENPHLSDRHFILSKSEPEPPALNS